MGAWCLGGSCCINWDRAIPRALCGSIARCLGTSIAWCLGTSIARCLDTSITWCLGTSITWCLVTSIAGSLTHSSVLVRTLREQTAVEGASAGLVTRNVL